MKKIKRKKKRKENEENSKKEIVFYNINYILILYSPIYKYDKDKLFTKIIISFFASIFG